jgi:hypothetical protein
VNRIWVEYAGGKAHAYCKACGRLLAVTHMPDVNLVWLDRVRDLDHGCSPMPDEWAVQAARKRHPSHRRRTTVEDDYIRVYNSGDGIVAQCQRCYAVLKRHEAALTTHTLREWLAAAEAHTCGQVAS